MELAVGGGGRNWGLEVEELGLEIGYESFFEDSKIIVNIGLDSPLRGWTPSLNSDVHGAPPPSILKIGPVLPSFFFYVENYSQDPMLKSTDFFGQKFSNAANFTFYGFRDSNDCIFSFT